MNLKRIISIFAALALCPMPIAAAGGENDFDEDTVFFEDFEDCAIGERPSEMNEKIGAQEVKYTVMGNSDIYVDDDGTGNKALKIIIDNDKAEFSVPLGTTLSKGTYIISMDMWLQNDSRHFERLMVPRDAYNFSAVTWFQTAKGKWCPKWVGYGSEKAIEKFDDYCKVECLIDCDKRTTAFYIDGELIGTDNNHVPQNNALGITSLWFLGTNSTANNGSAQGVGIYLIDNVTVRKNTLSVESTRPVNGEKSFGVDDDIRFIFTEELKEGTVNADTVALFENEEELPKDSYTVEVQDKEVSIFKNSGFEYDASYRVQFKDGIESVSGIEINPKKYKLEFKTEELIPEFAGILENGAVYDEGHIIELPQSPRAEYMIYVDSEEYNGEILNEAKHVVVVEATDSKGRTQRKEYNIEIVGARAPIAKDVKISGKAVTGEVLSANYNFVDVNGDKETDSIFRWYKSENENGNWELIKEETGENGKNYTLTPDDENCYIKLSVTPISDKDPKIGDEAESEPFMGDFAPIAQNLKIKGAANIGETLLAEYEYFDKNGDAEGESKVVWYAKGKDDTQYKSVAEGKSYTITELASDMFFIFGVVPKSENSPAKAEEYRSDEIKGPFAPEAKGIKIIGEAKAGKTVSVSYVFYDENGDSEGETIIKWFVNGKETAEGVNFSLDSSMTGDEIYAEITPVSLAEPFVGKTQKSESLRVSKKSSTSSGGFSGSSGGGSGGLPTVKPSDDEKDDEKNNDDKKTESQFIDMENHWAKADIEELFKKGIITGVSKTEFAPQKLIKRAECAAIIERALGLSEKNSDVKFCDVNKDDWFFESISAVNTAGYMQGADGYFRPNDPITREELAVLLIRVMGDSKVEKEQEVEFVDEDDISQWAKDAVAAAAKAGLVNGDETGKFNPKKTATRAETAVCIKRLLDLKK